MKAETNRMINEISLLMEVSNTITEEIISKTVDKYNVLLPYEYIEKEYHYTLKLLEQFNK
ncbi:hypothetical protein [Flavobacterium sp.]|uniref:hypothetical protein n=1 Tax=Flavobacterium sp. TaxID=239 RepID=UPI0033419DD2